MDSNLDPGWLAVAQIYATLAVAAAQHGIEGNVSELTQTQAIRKSKEYEAQALTALRAAGVEG